MNTDVGHPIVATPAQRTALKLWVVLARAHAAVAANAVGDIERHGLTLAEFGILEALYHKGPMLLGELQRRILVSSGGVTYLVDRLVKRELVERRECAEDRRARYAALTEDGDRFVEEIFPAHAECVRQALSGLSSSEQLETTRLLKALGLAAAERER
jgi:MarR family transcriptional regulator, 2-MHQ and catechol-resistance regulon repressor